MHLYNTFYVCKKFITLIKYIKNPKVLTNITHTFIALNFVKMLLVIYEKHEKVHLTLCRGTSLLVNIASKSEYPSSIYCSHLCNNSLLNHSWHSAKISFMNLHKFGIFWNQYGWNFVCYMSHNWCYEERTGLFVYNWLFSKTNGSLCLCVYNGQCLLHT